MTGSKGSKKWPILAAISALIAPGAGAAQFYAPQSPYGLTPYSPGATPSVPTTWNSADYWRSSVYSGYSSYGLGRPGLPGDPLSTPAPPRTQIDTTSSSTQTFQTYMEQAGDHFPPLNPGGQAFRTTLPAPAKAAEPASQAATLEIQVPEGAVIWLQGKKMTQTGGKRRFVTPPLETGYKYSYDVEARWKEGSREITRTRTITVRPGGAEQLSFLSSSPER